MSSTGSVARLFSQRRRVSLASAMLLSTAMFAFVGCQEKPKPVPPPPPPPMTMYDAQRVQADVRRTDPQARAGLVLRVKPDVQNAAVSLASTGLDPKMDPSRIKEGDAFTFTDSRNVPIAVGSVIYIDGEVYVIHYAPAEGGHAPAQGDLAIHTTR